MVFITVDGRPRVHSAPDRYAMRGVSPPPPGWAVSQEKTNDAINMHSFYRGKLRVCLFASGPRRTLQ